jgi:hypothetical protein
VGTAALVFDVTAGRPAGLTAGGLLLAVLLVLLVYVPLHLNKRAKRSSPPTYQAGGMAIRKILESVIAALALFALSPLLGPAAHAAPSAPAASIERAMAVQAEGAQAVAAQGAGVQAAVAAATNTPPPPTDPASTGPANPGTGETGEAEATRLDFAPLVIGAVAVITLVVILIWRRRRNTTIV